MDGGKTKTAAAPSRAAIRRRRPSAAAAAVLGWPASPDEGIGDTMASRAGSTGRVRKPVRLAAAFAALLAFATAGAPAAQEQTKEPTAYERGYAAYRTQDFGNALRWFVLAANKGDAAAQNMIGEMFGRGEGVAQDDAEALRWFTMAAEKNDHEAETNLGIAYREGYGVTRNYDLAYKWLDRAAQAGNPAAIFHLGVMYEHEMLIGEEEDAWIDLYESAAELGYGPAQARLGHMYETGVGFERSLDDAIYWYNQASLRGETTAQISLALLYMEGEGVPKDPVQAHALLSIASFLGNRGATSLILDLTKTMTKEQVDQSQAIASDMLAKIFAPAPEDNEGAR
jgi:TPR repeat protein